MKKFYLFLVLFILISCYYSGGIEIDSGGGQKEPDYTNPETYKDPDQLDYSSKDFDWGMFKQANGGKIPYQKIKQAGKQKEFYKAYKNKPDVLSETEKQEMYEELEHPIENVRSGDMGIITRTNNANQYASQISSDPEMQEAIREERNQNGLEMTEGNRDGINAFLESQGEATIDCKSGKCDEVTVENGPDGASLIQPYGQTTKCGIPQPCTVTPGEGGTQIGEDPEPPFVGGNAHIEFGNGQQQITGPDIRVGLTLPPDRNLLTGKLTMEGSSNVSLAENKKHFDKVRDGLIETKDSEGSYKTNLKDAEDITIYANGTYTVGHADVLELETNKNGKKDSIIVVNGNDISFDGNELHVGASDSIMINNRTVAVNPEDFYGYIDYQGYPGYPVIPKEVAGDFLDFKFNSSDAVIIGHRTYPELKESEFLLDNDRIAYVNLTSGKDDNILYFKDPRFDQDIVITIDENETAEMVSLDNQLEIRSNDQIEAELGDDIFRTLQPEKLKNYKTPIKGTMLVVADNGTLHLFDNANFKDTTDRVLVQQKNKKTIITTDDSIATLENPYHIEDEGFTGIEFSLRAFKDKVEVVEEYELLAVYSSDIISHNQTTVAGAGFSYTLPIVTDFRVSANVWENALDIEAENQIFQFTNLTLRYGDTGSYHDIYIIVNSHDDTGIHYTDFNNDNPYLITIFRPVNFPNSALIVNEGDYASLVRTDATTFDEPIVDISANQSYTMDKLLEPYKESYIIIDDNTFNLQNSEYQMKNQDNIETIYSPGKAEGTFSEKGITCTILQEHGAYMYSGISILADFAIEATDTFYHLCLRKQETESFDTSCYKCGVVDFVDSKMTLNNNVIYYRYPFRDTYTTSLVFMDVYQGFEQVYSEFLLGKRLIQIPEMKAATTLYRKDPATTKAAFSFLTIKETSINNTIHRIVTIKPEATQDNPFQKYSTSYEEPIVHFSNRYMIQEYNEHAIEVMDNNEYILKYS
jgi:hypothetical protein